MMKYIWLILIVFGISCSSPTEEEVIKPKLVIGFVVDQMRYDLLHRFETEFGEGGFKRLQNEGMLFRNCRYDYAQTLTGPGHASIAAGAPPSVHGIAANGWFDVQKMEEIYAVYDPEAVVVGFEGRDSVNGVSPANLKTETIGDVFKSAYGPESKVLGVSLKDRASILSAGRSADAAFWIRSSGYWATSDFYLEELPTWVKDWNEGGALRKYENEVWDRAMESYPSTTDKEVGFERVFRGQGHPGFPKNYADLVQKNGYPVLAVSPFGNTEIIDFGMEAIRQYSLGKDEIPDYLGLSISCTDKIGHAYGPYSEEIADTYIRLDKEIERFLNFLDQEIGQDDYTFFLTADHGIANIPGRIDSVNNGGGKVPIKKYFDTLNVMLEKKFGDSNIAAYYHDEQIWMDMWKIYEKGLDMEQISLTVLDYLESKPEIRKVIITDGLNADGELDALVLNGIYKGRSGQYFVLYEPGFVESWQTGVDHGSPYDYDRHIPLIFYGSGIHNGVSKENVAPTQITPSIARLLGIEPQNGFKGKFLPDLNYSE